MKVLIFLLTMLLVPLGASAQDAFPAPHGPPVTDDSVAADRAHSLARKLRCPTCQGLSAADSQAESAVAMENRTEQLIREGYSDDQILEWFTDRYGEWVLLEPPREGRHLLVWLGPLLALALGGGLVLRRVMAASGAPAEEGATADGEPPEDALPEELLRDPYVRRVLADVEGA